MSDKDRKRTNNKKPVARLVVCLCMISSIAISKNMIDAVRACCNTATQSWGDCCCEDDGCRGSSNDKSNTDLNIETIAELGNGTARTIAANKNILVAAVINRIIIFDTTNSDSIKEIGRIEFDGIVTAIKWSNGNLFAVIAPYGLIIIDMSDPANSKIINRYNVKEVTATMDMVRMF